MSSSMAGRRHSVPAGRRGERERQGGREGKNGGEGRCGLLLLLEWPAAISARPRGRAPADRGGGQLGNLGRAPLAPEDGGEPGGSRAAAGSNRWMDGSMGEVVGCGSRSR